MAVYIQTIVELLVVFLALFVSAGRWDVPMFWVYLETLILSQVAYLLLIDRDLKEVRRKPGREQANRPFQPLFFLFTFCVLIVAGLDRGRFSEASSVPLWLVGTGWGAMVSSYLLSLWSMRVNPFYLPVVRIQEERLHCLIDQGPYALIRHPGNLATAVWALSGGLVLGSWWAFFAFLPAVLLVGYHTACEDEYLVRNLPGYAEYKKRVHYRWIPGIW